MASLRGFAESFVLSSSVIALGPLVHFLPACSAEAEPPRAVAGAGGQAGSGASAGASALPGGGTGGAAVGGAGGNGESPQAGAGGGNAAGAGGGAGAAGTGGAPPEVSSEGDGNHEVG